MLPVQKTGGGKLDQKDGHVDLHDHQGTLDVSTGSQKGDAHQDGPAGQRKGEGAPCIGVGDQPDQAVQHYDDRPGGHDDLYGAVRPAEGGVRLSGAADLLHQGVRAEIRVRAHRDPPVFRFSNCIITK